MPNMTSKTHQYLPTFDARQTVQKLSTCTYNAGSTIPLSQYLDDSLLYLALELVGGGLDGHARAVKPEREQGVLALETLVLDYELTLRGC